MVINYRIVDTLSGLFNAFDENLDGHIDFREMACGISRCCRGPNAERQKCELDGCQCFCCSGVG